jgi:hypothetical protein
VLGLILLTCGLLGSALAVRAGRHHRRLVESVLAQEESDGHAVTYIEPAEALELRLRELWCAPSRPRWTRSGGIALLSVFVVAFALVPPFTPGKTWRSLTDWVPRPVVDVVPWSLYPRTTQVTSADDGNGTCGNTTIFAFGYVWGADAQVGPGTFRQVDRTHGVLNGVMFTGGISRFNRLDCMVPVPQTAHSAPEPLPNGSQPPNPCHLLTSEELTAALAVSVGEPMQSKLATDGNGEAGRVCVWDVAGGNREVAVNIVTAKALATALAMDKRASLGPPWPSTSLHGIFADDQPWPFQDLRILGHPAHYWHDAGGQGSIRVLTPTAFVFVVVAGTGVVHDQATLAKLATLATRRIGSTGP